MRILWITNIILPIISKDLGLPQSNYGGWLTSLADDIVSTNEHELIICFPFKSNRTIHGHINGIEYINFDYKKTLEYYDKNLKSKFIDIIKQFKPDIVHIFGTEFPHSFSMIEAAKETGLINKTLIHIQGMVSIYAKHFKASIPVKYYIGFSFRDFLRKSNMNMREKRMSSLGNYERLAIKNAIHVSGRTTWDFECTKRINEGIKYHYCNESLRAPFYENKWNYENCDKFTLFTTQGESPIKGLHYLLEALSLVSKKHPEAKLYIAGSNPTLIKWYRRTSYQNYILKLIKLYKLQSNVVFTGQLTQDQMCQRLIKSNIFILPSSIENSPNSLGEAMLVGVPCISSYVGGVPDLLTHNVEGFLYQTDATYMLAHYIEFIFRQNKEFLNDLSLSTRKRAQSTHNRSNNLKCILSIYKEINFNL